MLNKPINQIWCNSVTSTLSFGQKGEAGYSQAWFLLGSELEKDRMWGLHVGIQGGRALMRTRGPLHKREPTLYFRISHACANGEILF